MAVLGKRKGYRGEYGVQGGVNCGALCAHSCTCSCKGFWNNVSKGDQKGQKNTPAEQVREVPDYPA
ncbi:MAG: hypothetical protein K6A30_01175 [Lachnospiraceae bacterium]|nr:hypothetical protein [Lachnospiraceae bacterium]